MRVNTNRPGRRLHRFCGHSVHLLVITLLALVFAAPTLANPALEHIDGVPLWATQAILSGDGQWFVRWDSDGGGPFIAVHDLSSGLQNTVYLRQTTSFANLRLSVDYNLDINHDGSVIVAWMDNGSANTEGILVLSPDGTEIAHVTGTDYYGDPLVFDEPVYIDSTGKYVIFSAEARTLSSVVAGGGGGKYTFSGDYNNVFRMDVQTGVIDLVPITAGGGETNWYSHPFGISEKGKFVLFRSPATNLPGATGENLLYVREMTLTDQTATTLVSVDAGGTPISKLDCCGTNPDFSADGFNVSFTESSTTSSDGFDHTYLWTLGSGSRELTRVMVDEEIKLSGDGQWLTASGAAYARLNLASGSRYLLPDDGNGTPVHMNDISISDNGETILFWNSSITPPIGEDGRWWLLRFDPIPGPIEISVNETIPVNDTQNLLLGINLPVNETVSVLDDILVTPGLSIAVVEPVGVSDVIEVTVGPTLADTIELILPPGPLLPGMAFTAKAGGFKPFTAVQAFLQPDPVLVGEEMADADGNVSFQITIPPDFPPGDHTLSLLGQKPDGSERQLTAAIRVDQPDTIFKSGFE